MCTIEAGMSTSLTQLIQEAGHGDAALAERLFPVAYAELRRLAASLLRSQRAGHTLQATALVHEAYMKLLAGEAPAFESRAHFFGVAARAMRQILVDHARRQASEKRGGGAQRLELNEALAYSPNAAGPLLELDEGLEALSRFDARKAKAIEMRFFAGMSNEEIAAALDVSVPTVKRDLRVAEAWLAARLGSPAPH